MQLVSASLSTACRELSPEKMCTGDSDGRCRSPLEEDEVEEEQYSPLQKDWGACLYTVTIHGCIPLLPACIMFYIASCVVFYLYCLYCVCVCV